MTTPNKSGTTLLADIRSLLNNSELTDIILVPTINNDLASTYSEDEGYIGTLAEEVPAIKAILAARSPVFRRMLYGDFRERNRNNNISGSSRGEDNDDDDVLRVKLDYGGHVLRLLVEFCFTDRLDSLEEGNSSSADVVNEDENHCTNNNNDHGSNNEESSQVTESNTSQVTTDDDNQKLRPSASSSSSNDNEPSSAPSLSRTARLLTSLASVAHYFDIPKLEHDISSRLHDIMTSHPSLACVVLDEGSKIMSEELCTAALERIRARPKAALLPSCETSSSALFTTSIENKENVAGGVASLSASLLEQVVFDEKSCASEWTKFMCLQRWVEGCCHEVKMHELESLSLKHASELPSDEEGDDVNDIATPTTTSSPKSKTHMEQKRRIAATLAQKLDLSLIPASDLDTISTESNLLSHQDLYKAYRLQALNAERTKSKVFVEGAGLSEINGTYIQGGVHEGIPMYNKEGVWRDREEIFRIFLCTYSNGNKSWCISIVPKGKEPGKTTDVDFYECPVSYGKGSGGGSGLGGAYNSHGVGENGLGVVPSRGWKLVNFGQPPTPKCSLIAGVSSD
ncbi:hypothetical protein ACHAWO_008149 [Cyclotella atomus]|uniref:BTB domain-containing protein n=1 Tax=Cyclotella atomus TaxID=382360 RepID=A0ABD3PMA2_9STRA